MLRETLSIVGAVGLVLAGCGTGSPDLAETTSPAAVISTAPPTPSNGDVLIAIGEAIFRGPGSNTCVGCHGPNGEGGPSHVGPNIAGKTAADIQAMIDRGEEMAFLDLSPRQLAALESFLGTLAG